MALIKFRLQYSSQFGQELFVAGSIPALGKGKKGENIPLRFINQNTWGADIKISGKLPKVIRYSYFIKDERSGQIQHEQKERTLSSSELKKGTLIMDSWSSPRNLEYTFQTKAFNLLLENKIGRSKLSKFNIQWSLDVSLVPKDHVLCISGSTKELGYWHSAKPILMQKKGRSTWVAAAILDIPELLEYKYGFYSLKEKKVTIWEEGPNRKITFTEDDKKVFIADEGFRKDFSGAWRGSGVAIPVFSLRSKASMGVGDFVDLKLLVDWCVKAGQKLIQILPINDTSAHLNWIDSYPYAAISVFALHPMYLRLESLPFKIKKATQKKIDKAKEALKSEGNTYDYEGVMKAKMSLAREIFESNFKTLQKDKDFAKFMKSNKSWIHGYAVFSILRDEFGTANSAEWPRHKNYEKKEVEAFFDPTHESYQDVLFYCFLQFCLDHQLTEAVSYAHDRGVVMKGDLPIGVSRYSCDVWMNADLFNLDMQAGAPPDPLSKDGQNWGFPTYRWDKMKSNNYRWWKERFAFLDRYFDVFRIDHILGFFRIWQVPYEQTSAILGYFEPSVGYRESELKVAGVPFSQSRYVKPYITLPVLRELGIKNEDKFIEDYLQASEEIGLFDLKESNNTQRKVLELKEQGAMSEEDYRILQELLINVLFIAVDTADGETVYHPRQLIQDSSSYRYLHADVQGTLVGLYNHYFYGKQEDFWEGEGMKKLPLLQKSTDMLICAEDLGMVPAAVPKVLEELGMLKLQVQRMPSKPGIVFSRAEEAEYMCVVTASSHDTSTLRGWWEENRGLTESYYREILGRRGEVPEHCDASIIKEIVHIHLESPAMWAIQPMQEYMNMDEKLHWPDPEEERINIPSQIPHYWRWRMHIDLEDMIENRELNNKLYSMVRSSGRAV